MSESAAPLPDDLALCHEIIRQQADTIRESQRRIEQLEHQVEQLLRRQYGPRRESIDPDQLRLFADVEASGTAFAANLLGAMVGGTLEYLALLTGYRFLLVVVAALYALAFITYRLVGLRPSYAER